LPQRLCPFLTISVEPQFGQVCSSAMDFNS
jgi:hypothetical protein